ncbi:MAG: CHC2 zinc finger domain-containing protein [Eubacteriales bacterium]
MGANVFETVKQSVTIREAAERYGIEVKRGGMACCPFHDDKNPSMKLNEEYFYCFGCGATGDVIDLTARLYNLSPKEAAEKLAQDFGLIYDSQAPPRRNYVHQKTEARKFREDRTCFAYCPITTSAANGEAYPKHRRKTTPLFGSDQKENYVSTCWTFFFRK